MQEFHIQEAKSLERTNYALRQALRRSGLKWNYEENSNFTIYHITCDNINELLSVWLEAGREYQRSSPDQNLKV